MNRSEDIEGFSIGDRVTIRDRKATVTELHIHGGGRVWVCYRYDEPHYRSWTGGDYADWVEKLHPEYIVGNL